MTRCVLIAVVGLIASTATAGERPEVGPPPAWVLPATIPPPPPGTADVAVIPLLADQQVRLTAEGDAAYTDSAIRIGSSQGLGAAALALVWDPALDSLVIHRYRIIRDGQSIDLLGDGSKLTVVRRETNLERATLDGQLTATFQPDGVRVGDVIDIAFTRTRRDPALLGRSQHAFAVGPATPFGRLRLRALWPASKPVHWRAGPGLLVPKEARSGTDRELVFDQTNVTAPRAPRSAPTRFQAINYVALSDMGNWRDLSKLMAPLYVKAAQLAPGSALRTEATRIAAASPDPKVRALAALRLVQDQVRYVLLAIDDGGYVPADAELTWSRRFGDCKGKTVLLTALLRELGIDARPALVSTGGGDGLDQRLPMAGAFDHVMVEATIAGRTYWLDGTRTGDRALDRIRTPEFYWALPVTTAGADLVKLVPDPLDRPSGVVTLTLDATKGLDVPAHATGEQRFDDDAALSLRIALAQMPPEQRDRALRDYWHNRYDFITADSAAMIDDPATGSVRLTMSGTAKMDWTRYNGIRWYRLDGSRLGFTLDTAREPGPNRDAPFALNYPSWLESHETILLPNKGAGFTVDGADVDRTIAAMAFHRTVKLTGNVLKMSASTRVLGPEIAFADAEKAKVALAELNERDVSVGARNDYMATDDDVVALKAQSPTSVDAYIERGNVMLDRGEYPAALRDADAAIALNPASAPAHGLRAMALAWQGNADSETSAARSLALDPKLVTGWHARALIANKANDYALAEAHLTKAIGLWPNDGWALGRRARVRTSLGHFADALADVDATIALAPDEFSLLAQRIPLLVVLDRRPDALADLEKFSRTHPDNIDAVGMRAYMLDEMGRRAEAAAALDAMVAAHPGDDEALHRRAVMRPRLGNRDGAFADFATIIARHPTANILAERAQLWPLADRTHWSSDLDAAARLEPNNLTVLMARAVIQTRVGDYKAAEAAVAQAQRLYPDNAMFASLKMEILGKQGRGDEVVQLLEAQLKTDPVNPELLNNLCWTKATRNIRLDTAVADCDAALKLSPGNPAYLDSRGLARLRLGQFDAAIADYDVALAKRPDQPTSLFGRALAKARAGKDATADFAAARKSTASIDKVFADFGLPAPPSR